MGPYANRILNPVSAKLMFLLLAGFLLAGSFGCSQLSSYHKAYDGPFKPVREVAVLVSPSTTNPRTVDGRQALGNTIELTPGKHCICTD